MRWVYGNRTKKWYKVTKNDRDYSMGIPDWQFKNMTKKEALSLWNVPTIYFKGRTKINGKRLSKVV
jgi:hypothetical protein